VSAANVPRPHAAAAAARTQSTASCELLPMQRTLLKRLKTGAA
jgi:hypothetical protein